MPRIAVFYRSKTGAMPRKYKAPTEEQLAELGLIELNQKEVADLVRLKVWAEPGTPEAENNWVRYGADESIWAGSQEGPEAPVGKLRGKGGRLVSNRVRLPADEKWRTTSIQMPGKTRQRLEEIAAERTAAEGKRVTISTIINELVDAFLGIESGSNEEEEAVV